MSRARVAPPAGDVAARAPASATSPAALAHTPSRPDALVGLTTLAPPPPPGSGAHPSDGAPPAPPSEPSQPPQATSAIPAALRDAVLVGSGIKVVRLPREVAPDGTVLCDLVDLGRCNMKTGKHPLVDLCKMYGLYSSGKKDLLIRSLVEFSQRSEADWVNALSDVAQRPHKGRYGSRRSQQKLSVRRRNDMLAANTPGFGVPRSANDGRKNALQCAVDLRTPEQIAGIDTWIKVAEKQDEEYRAAAQAAVPRDARPAAGARPGGSPDAMFVQLDEQQMGMLCDRMAAHLATALASTLAAVPHAVGAVRVHGRPVGGSAAATADVPSSCASSAARAPALPAPDVVSQPVNATQPRRTVKLRSGMLELTQDMLPIRAPTLSVRASLEALTAAWADDNVHWGTPTAAATCVINGHQIPISRYPDVFQRWPGNRLWEGMKHQFMQIKFLVLAFKAAESPSMFWSRFTRDAKRMTNTEIHKALISERKQFNDQVVKLAQATYPGPQFDANFAYKKSGKTRVHSRPYNIARVYVSRGNTLPDDLARMLELMVQMGEEDED